MSFQIPASNRDFSLIFRIAKSFKIKIIEITVYVFLLDLTQDMTRFVGLDVEC